jgi:hypothetical protein
MDKYHCNLDLKIDSMIGRLSQVQELFSFC